MGYHIPTIHEIFNDNYFGLDLEFAEIKTTNTKKEQYTIYMKDFNAKYFIFFNFRKNEGLICLSHSLLRFINEKTHSGIYHSKAKKFAIFISNSLIELYNFYKNEEKNLKNTNIHIQNQSIHN